MLLYRAHKGMSAFFVCVNRDMFGITRSYRDIYRDMHF